jgi:hypothetical protein
LLYHHPLVGGHIRSSTVFGDIFQRWQERRAKAKADKAALAKRVQVFLDETKPLVPKSKSSHTEALLYRHAWRRAFAIASLYEAKGQKHKYEEYRAMALELSEKYKAVAPETLYGKVKLSPGGEAFERILQFELQRLFPEALPAESRPLACIYIGTCDQGRIYIGQTVGAPELRWAQHRMANSGPFKDGEKYVTWAVLEKEVEQSKLNEREAYYIGFYDADRSGYNETSGNDWAAYKRGQADRAKQNKDRPITRGFEADQITREEMEALQDAAEKGDVDAQYELGEAYYNGWDVPQDYARAVKWWLRAAGQGDSNAQYQLGCAFSNGEGCVQDNVTSHMWFSLSWDTPSVRHKQVSIERWWSGRGFTLFNPSANEQMHEIEKEMTALQIAEAQRRAREWIARQAS